MKKTGKIWLLSIIPGLGHFILGDVRMGIVFLASIVFLGIFMIFSPSETVFIICLVLGIIVWSYQWVHAVTMAGRKSREVSGLALVEREVIAASLPAETSRAERSVYKARLTVMQLLPPGESLRAVIYASKGSYSLASILLALLFDSGGAGNETGVVYMGITERDFLFIDTDLLGKPSELYRVSVEQVSLVKFKQGGLSDELVINIGETGPHQFSVGHAFRQQMRQLIQILNGMQV